MSGMGTLHLEVKRHRLERDFRLKVRVGKPRGELPRDAEDARDGRGRMRPAVWRDVAVCPRKVEFSNRKSEQPVTVTSKVKPGDVNPVFFAAAERGLKSALQSGELGFPVLDVQAVIVGAHDRPGTFERSRLRGGRQRRGA